MKKIYSLVLMAAMLLVGTNASAKEFSGTTAAELQKAVADIIYGVETDSEIKLKYPVNLDQTIWVGTETLDGPYKSITIDLNGHNISYNATTSDSKAVKGRTVIALTHGELNIINTGDTAKVQLTGVANDGAAVIAVYGSYKSSRWNKNGTALIGEGTNTRVQGWCSHLYVAPKVKLYAEEDCEGTGLYIGAAGGLKYPEDNGDGTYTLANVAYNIAFMKTSGWGFAHGVSVDFWGKINFQGTNSGKAYGIKVNGTTRSPLSCQNDAKEGISDFNKKAFKPATDADDDLYLTNYYSHNAEINKDATLATDATHKRDTVDVPFLWIHPGSEIKVRKAGNKVTALYGGGYAKWLVQGYAEGKTGMYVSAGVMDLNDAHVKSTAESWESATSAGSANGGGSGVVINSRSNYAGGVEFTVSGDSRIESIEGYAIEEIVNTTPVPNPAADPESPDYDPSAPATIQVTKVATISIEGGTIQGGDEGAIVVSTATLSEAAKSDDVDVVVYGGNVIGDSYAGDKGAVATGSLEDLIPNSGYHVTEVTVDGKTTVVVSQGAEPETANTVTGADEYTAIKWQNTSIKEDTIKVDKVLTELEINETYAQTLTIAEGHKLTVGHIILGENAKIVVKPGAKLVVTGKDGISASKVGNVLLESSEAAQAVLLYSSAVVTNRQPKATVNLAVAHGQDGSGENVWTRYAMPVQVLDSMRREYPYTTWVYGWDYEADAWALLSSVYEMKPWTGYTLSYNETTAETYKFYGNLVGNINAPITFVHKGYNFFGNSYTGYVDAKTLLQGLADEHIDGTIYMWNASMDNPANQGYSAVTLNRLVNQADKLQDWQKDVAPMQTFILQLRDATNASESMNYASAVYGNPRHGNTSAATSAPKRALAKRSEEANIQIVVTAINGKSDRVNLTEGAEYTDAFESGFDASKYMNKNTVNLYATVKGENYSDVVTNNLEGKMITLQTSDAAYYTISFDLAEGNEYALLDKVTNAVVAIEEGAIYEFAAQPNSTIEGRFEIIGRNNAPTAIENTEVKANVKGIYSITGMYMGENFDVLPAGVYVVDGVKIVK